MVSLSRKSILPSPLPQFAGHIIANQVNRVNVFDLIVTLFDLISGKKPAASTHCKVFYAPFTVVIVNGKMSILKIMSQVFLLV